MLSRAHRWRVLVTLPLVALCLVFVVLKQSPGVSSFTRHLLVDSIWAAFSLVAALACFWTARRTPSGGRRVAWWLFGAGCLSWFVGILEWARLELIVGRLNPFPSVADGFYLMTPLLFIGGMAQLRLNMRTRPRSLLQLGNVGLVMAAVALVVTVVLAAPVRSQAGSSLGVVISAANVIFYSADFLFGLYCLIVAGGDRGWRVLALLVVGQGVNTLVVLAYIRAVIDTSYSVGGWLDVGFCVLFSMVILAALEQALERSGPGPASAPSPELTWLDALVPALALGAAATAVIPYSGSVALVPGWLLLAEVLLLVIFVGLHGIASRRIMSDLAQELWRSEDRMREAQKFQSLGTLASGLAHDFNNILTVVSGHLALLRSRPDPEASLRVVEEALAQGVELNKSLLSLARPGDDARATVDVRHLLGVVARLVRAAVPAATRIRTEVGDVPAVVLASGPMQQALLNLALNARDSMPDGGEMVLGARVESEDDGEQLVLFVTDSGEGMDPAIASRAFEPFFTTKGDGRGTGLGLAMVSHVARSHGGRAHARTERGVGSTFSISIPLRRAPDSPRSSDLPAASRSRKRVLVVEDELEVRAILLQVIRADGWVVESACDGVEALEILSRGAPFQAVVTDLDMPRLDGLQLVREIRKAWPELPVILVSGHLPIDDSLPDLFHARFAKPVRFGELLQCLRATAKAPT